MDPAVELFEALEERERAPGRYARAVSGVRHLLERAGRTVIQRRPGLVEAAKIELDDLVQELSQKLLREPPVSRGSAEAVIVGWAKVVARNHLLDLAAKRERETGDAPEVAIDRDPDRSFDARLAYEQLERCADELTERHRAAFELLREDAEMSRMEIARRLELISREDAEATLERVKPKSALAERVRKAQANAWAIVSRVRARLADCLDRHGMLDLLPDTLAKLRRRAT